MISKKNHSEFETLSAGFKNGSNPKSASIELKKYSLINYPVVSGGRYEYVPTEGVSAGNVGRPDENLDTIDDSGNSFLDGQYWCDTGTWEFGPYLVSPPKPTILGRNIAVVR